jgi:hypothetical protein
MSAFDLILRLFGLLLGLAMGEVLAGVVRTFRLKLDLTPTPAAKVRVGWLVPLLGLLILLAQISFWLSFYELHGNVPLDLLMLAGILAVVGGFYVISGLVFPSHPERWPDFDDYYFRVRRSVLGGLLAILVTTMAFFAGLVVHGVPFAITTGAPNAAGSLAALLFLPVLVALLVVRGRRASLVLLLLANAMPLVEALTRFR